MIQHNHSRPKTTHQCSSRSNSLRKIPTFTSKKPDKIQSVGKKLEEIPNQEMCPSCYQLFEQGIQAIQVAHQNELLTLKRNFEAILQGFHHSVTSQIGCKTAYIFKKSYFSDLERLKTELVNLNIEQFSQQLEELIMNPGGNAKASEKEGQSLKKRRKKSRNNSSLKEPKPKNNEASEAVLKPISLNLINVNLEANPELKSLYLEENEDPPKIGNSKNVKDIKVRNKSRPKRRRSKSRKRSKESKIQANSSKFGQNSEKKFNLLSPIPEKDKIFETLDSQKAVHKTPKIKPKMLVYSRNSRKLRNQSRSRSRSKSKPKNNAPKEPKAQHGNQAHNLKRNNFVNFRTRKSPKHRNKLLSKEEYSSEGFQLSDLIPISSDSSLNEIQLQKNPNSLQNRYQEITPLKLAKLADKSKIIKSKSRRTPKSTAQIISRVKSELKMELQALQSSSRPPNKENYHINTMNGRYKSQKGKTNELKIAYKTESSPHQNPKKKPTNANENFNTLKSSLTDNDKQILSQIYRADSKSLIDIEKLQKLDRQSSKIGKNRTPLSRKGGKSQSSKFSSQNSHLQSKIQEFQGNQRKETKFGSREARVKAHKTILATLENEILSLSPLKKV